MEIAGVLSGSYWNNSHKREMVPKGTDFEKSMQNFQSISSEKNPVPTEALMEKMDGKGKVPYGERSKAGIINYNGVIFVCDETKNRLCLGDVSDNSNCISVTLSGGGSLVVNRDNIDELAKAISMFSPEDINRILEAIAEDNRLRQVQSELEEDTEGAGVEDTEEARQKKIRELLKEPSFQIGGSTFTIKEWENFLEKFDSTEEKLREEMRAEIEKRKEEQAAADIVDSLAQETADREERQSDESEMR